MDMTTHRCPVIFYPCDEGGFVAGILSLPGCMAQGVTVEECIEELELIIDLWLETARKEKRPIPDPDTVIEQIRLWNAEIRKPLP